ncbi:FAS-associated factor 2 [Tetranychus urticae]|uniref:UBX domain-containing protein n=1 Tax=Tetranychus urticae TaxID=32264 RepID=T1KRU0_TETUR|nr:FAS-associated factor 2 [Tetranychus urticae]
MDGLVRLITFPFQFIYETLLSALRLAWNLVRRRIDIVDPLGDTLKFISDFESVYGTEHPVFYRGTYEQALSDAKKELKFLLIYLHSEHHRDTHDFCTNVLSHQLVINYINRNKLLFWGCSVDSREGYRVSVLLRASTTPFLALFALKDNRMNVVRTFFGPTSVERLLSNIQQAIEENEGSLIAARLERQERTMNQRLREEQDVAYMESLRADQEKDRKKQEEKVKKENEERERKQKELEEVQQRELLLNLKVSLATEIPNEPPADDPESIRIVIKLPNGTRLERRFRKSDPLKYLYYFVFCNEQSPLKFQITTNFPRKELPGSHPTLDNKENCSLTFDSAGLGKSQVFFVHDLEA